MPGGGETQSKQLVGKGDYFRSFFSRKLGSTEAGGGLERPPGEDRHLRLLPCHRCGSGREGQMALGPGEGAARKQRPYPPACCQRGLRPGPPRSSALAALPAARPQGPASPGGEPSHLHTWRVKRSAKNSEGSGGWGRWGLKAGGEGREGGKRLPKTTLLVAPPSVGSLHPT